MPLLLKTITFDTKFQRNKDERCSLQQNLKPLAHLSHLIKGSNQLTFLILNLLLSNSKTMNMMIRNPFLISYERKAECLKMFKKAKKGEKKS